MDIYAKYEITEKDNIPEDLLFADSIKALGRTVKKLNEAHKIEYCMERRTKISI